MSEPAPRWLVLTHHLPPDPPYLRVKVRRQLERLGAVALKNSVYVLPSSAGGLEDFAWLRQEIEREGGDATVAEASFVDGVTDGRLIERFRAARAADYVELAASARALLEEMGAGAPGGASPEARVERLNERLQELRRMDFFQAPGRAAAEHAVTEAQAGGRGPDPGSCERTLDVGRGRTWVTRVGVGVDRIASAWLIRRFIDPEARFAFAPARGYEAAAGELRFDMFEGEFTHVGDACTFETLLARFRLDAPALVALAEIVHDIDCKDDKFRRPDVAGIASMIDGVVRRHADDEARLARGADLLDALYEHFSTGT